MQHMYTFLSLPMSAVLTLLSSQLKLQNRPPQITLMSIFHSYLSSLREQKSPCWNTLSIAQQLSVVVLMKH